MKKEQFLERGYPSKSIQHAYGRAKTSKYLELMTPRRRTHANPHENMVRFITPFNSRNVEMRLALRKYWDIHTSDDVVCQYLPADPSVTFKRARNLGDMLVRSHTGTLPKNLSGSRGPRWGCKPCGDCVACLNIELTNIFWDSNKTREYRITHTITFVTKFVVYFAVCPCGLIYVGLTSRELHRRV